MIPFNKYSLSPFYHPKINSPYKKVFQDLIISFPLYFINIY